MQKGATAIITAMPKVTEKKDEHGNVRGGKTHSDFREKGKRRWT